MLVVVQFPIGDARGLSADGAGRVSRPDWGASVGFGYDQFVREFGKIVDRKRPADTAWLDERFFCQARHAIALTGLQKSRSPSLAFRRLFVGGSRVVARVDLGFDVRMPRVVEDPSAAIVASISSLTHVASRVPASDEPGSERPLISQGRRLARRYAKATTLTPTSESGKLVDAGRPVVIVEMGPGERFAPPVDARRLKPDLVGESQLAFMWLRSDLGPVPTWILKAGPYRDRTRSLRLCLSRLHSEQQALDVVLRFLQREWLRYVPGSEAGDRLTRYLDDATARVKKAAWSGISQSAILEAVDAADLVTEPDDRAGLLQALEGAQRQVALKTESYWHEREMTRTVGNYYRIEAGGKLVKDSVEIHARDINQSNIVNAKRMRDAVLTFQAAPVSDERKAAVEQLATVATTLVERLDDETAKEEVTKRVEVISKSAADPDPMEDVIRAAGQTIVKIGSGIQDLAEPIANAVNAVLSVLKFAPILL